MRAAAPLAAVALALASAAPADAKRTSCRSGETLYNEGGVRIFSVTKTYRDRSLEVREPYLVYLGCRPGSRRYTVLHSSDPFTYPSVKRFEREGDRVLFVVETSSETSISLRLGWFDARTGRRRVGLLIDDGYVELLRNGLAAGEDGGIAYLAYAVQDERPAEVVGYLPMRANGRFGRARILATDPAGGIPPASLAVAGGRVTWTTATGQAASAPASPA